VDRLPDSNTSSHLEIKEGEKTSERASTVFSGISYTLARSKTEKSNSWRQRSKERG